MNDSATRVGRVMRSSTGEFTIGTRLLQADVPRFGAFVKAPSTDGCQVIGLIYDVLIEDDPFVRQLVTARPSLRGATSPPFRILELPPGSRSRLPGCQAFRDQGIHLGEIVPHVLPAVDDERGVPVETTDQTFEEAFDGGGIHEPDRHPRPVPVRQPVGPLGEGMEFGREVVREPGVELLPVDLLTQPGDLPGHLAVLSMLEVGRDVRDDFDAERPLAGDSAHGLSPCGSLTQPAKILYLRSRKRNNAAASGGHGR